MNNPRALLLRLIPATCIVLLLGFILSPAVRRAPHHAGEALNGLPGADGEAYEDNAARARWELSRLRDPATGRIPPGIRSAELAYARTLPTHGSGLYKSAGIADYGWAPSGPVNIGGRTRALALDMRGEDTILAGGVSGGMWRSTDAGRTWTRTTLPSQLQSVSCIVQDPRPGKQATFYYGTGEILGSSASENGAYFGGDGYFKSTDGGRTWVQRLTSGTPHSFDQLYDYVWRIAVDPSNLQQDELYMATYGGISRSTNGGSSWSGTTVLSSTSSSAMCDVAVTDSGVVYATLSSEGSKRGIWRSADGVAWKNITPTGFPAEYRRIVIGITPSNPNVVYFLAETPGAGKPGLNFKRDTSWSSLWKYTYISGDGTGAGGAWENRTANLPSFGGSFGDYNPQFSYDMHIAVKPDNPNVVCIGGTNVYRSTDAFATADNVAWIGGYRNVTLDSAVRLQLEYPNHHPDQHTMVYSRANPNVAYTGSDGGVHRTDNIMAPEVAWNTLNAGYTTSQFYMLAIDQATPGNHTVVGGLQDNGTWLAPSADAVTPWNWIGSGDGSFCAIADGRSSVYVSKQEGKAYRVLLNDDGTLKDYTRIDPLGGTNYLFINPFALNPTNTSMMFLSVGNQLWRNSDLTAIPLGSSLSPTLNWQQLANATTPAGTHITAFGVSTREPANRLYYGTDSGRVYRIDNADQGDPVPLSVTDSLFPKKGNVGCIAVDPFNADRAVAVFTNYSVQSLFLTVDGGAHWEPIGGNLEQNANGSGAGPSCRWFAFVKRGSGTVYLVGTSTGLYSTTSLAGRSTVWALEGPATIGNMVVDVVVARPEDGFVAVGTHGGGVFTTTIAPLGVDNGDGAGGQGVVQAQTLNPPVPNPVGRRSRISFVLRPESAGRVRLALYNQLGQCAAVVGDGVLEAGPHEMVLDLLDPRNVSLASGTYYLRLETRAGMSSQAVRVAR